MATEKKSPPKVITLPEGRLINHSLFKLDQFNEEAKPSYKIELAFAKDGGVLDKFFEELLQFADDEWGPFKEGDKRGDLNIDGGELICGVIDGETLKEKREAKGKKGDAYAGMWVLRAKTSFNKHGLEGEGGVTVYDANVEPIEPVQAELVYPGCYGHAAITLKGYPMEDKVRGKTYHAITYYLTAFQKTRDGEKLFSAADHSQLFKPVGRQAGAEAGAGRRQRKG